MQETHRTVLRHLWHCGCIGGRHTSKENTVKIFPSNKKRAGKKAIEELIRRNLIIAKPTSYGQQISLNPRLIRDIKRLINPSEKLSDGVYENSLRSGYAQRPFHKTRGQHPVRGAKAEYRYHKGTQSDVIVCHVVVNGVRKSTINLGSFSDPTSLLAKAVRGIDANFRGRVFKKAHLHVLGREIVGNKQPIHAIIEMLLHFGYCTQTSARHYERTTKQLPKPPLAKYLVP